MNIMKPKHALLEFVTNWTEGAARAITQQDRKMLAELKTCLDPFPDDFGEQLGVPGGSTFGGVAEYIRDVLEEGGMGDHAARSYLSDSNFLCSVEPLHGDLAVGSAQVTTDPVAPQ